MKKIIVTDEDNLCSKKLPNKLFQNYHIFLAIEYPECQICGEDIAVDHHHLFYGSFGADKDDRCLIAVCRRCHEWCHRNKRESQDKYKEIAYRNWREFNEIQQIQQ